MSSKFATIFILLASAISANPLITVDVSKTKFLFFKWIDFTPSYVAKNESEKVDLSSRSKFYIFADYFGLVQKLEMGITISYKINGGAASTPAPLTVTVTDEKINTEAFTVKECFADDKFVATFQNVVRNDNDFTLEFDITCTVVNIPNAIRELGNGVADLVENIQKDDHKDSKPKVEAGIKNASVKQNVDENPAQVIQEEVPKNSKQNIAPSVHEAIQEQVELQGSKRVIL